MSRKLERAERLALAGSARCKGAVDCLAQLERRTAGHRVDVAEEELSSSNQHRMVIASSLGVVVSIAQEEFQGAPVALAARRVCAEADSQARQQSLSCMSEALACLWSALLLPAQSPPAALKRKVDVIEAAGCAEAGARARFKIWTWHLCSEALAAG